MNRWWTHALENWANQISARFGHPVFLVGSAIEKGVNARDVDVVCIVPDEEFIKCYGPLKGSYALTSEWGAKTRTLWAEVGKLSAVGRRLTGLPIDFKVQSMAEVYELFRDRPAVRLDTLPYETD